MEFLEWNASFSVGDAHLDAQHKEWFRMVAEADRAADQEDADGIRKRLAFFAGYALVHFEDEERHMAEFQFPGLDEHRRVHHTFVAQVSQLRKAYDANPDSVTAQEILPFIHDWLVFHILGMDKQYQTWIEQTAGTTP